jgi:hypothetical protein
LLNGQHELNNPLDAGLVVGAAALATPAGAMPP